MDWYGLVGVRGGVWGDAYLLPAVRREFDSMVRDCLVDIAIFCNFQGVAIL